MWLKYISLAVKAWELCPGYLMPYRHEESYSVLEEWSMIYMYHNMLFNILILPLTAICIFAVAQEASQGFLGLLAGDSKQYSPLCKNPACYQFFQPKCHLTWFISCKAPSNAQNELMWSEIHQLV